MRCLTVARLFFVHDLAFLIFTMKQLERWTTLLEYGLPILNFLTTHKDGPLEKKKSPAGSMRQVPSQAFAVNCIGRSTLRWAKEKSSNLRVTGDEDPHGQYPIRQVPLGKVLLSFPLTLWIRRDCLSTLKPYYTSEQ